MNIVLSPSSPHLRKRNKRAFSAALLGILVMLGSAHQAPSADATASKPAPEGQTKPSPESQPAAKSKAEIDALIEEAGRTYPEWWNSVELDYPKTLDLEGTKNVKGWQPNVKLGSYYWDHIQCKPDRWKQGVKLLDLAVRLRQDNPQARLAAMHILAGAHHHLLKDYARAAFWWRSILELTARRHVAVRLAECYWKLGSKRMAVEFLTKRRLHHRGFMESIKLWSDMDEHNIALELAEDLANRNHEAGYLATGNVYRAMAQYDKAIAAYKKVLAGRNKKARMMRQRAETNIETLGLYKILDISKIPDGIYTATSPSFRGPLTVQVTTKKGQIESVKVLSHRETRIYTSVMDIPTQIVERQSVEDIDAVSGATVISHSIVNAVSKALAGAAKTGRPPAEPN